MTSHRLLSLAALLIVAPLSLCAQNAAAKPATPANNAKQAAVTSAAATNPNRNALLDINTASPDQLMQLPGIGEAYSKRIIDGRPYTAKTQLVSRGILPKATYDGVSSQIIAKHAAKK